jgi:ribosomal protein S18 acetylase RimI-like enzyme
MQIRTARSHDLKAVLELDQIHFGVAERAAFIRRALDEQTAVVAVDAEAVCGVAVLEYTFFGNGFISFLFVGLSHRRREIGRDLMRSVEARCRTPKLFTSTNGSNQPMRALLTALGYVPSGVVHNLDPCDPEHFYFRQIETPG